MARRTTIVPATAFECVSCGIGSAESAVTMRANAEGEWLCEICEAYTPLEREYLSTTAPMLEERLQHFDEAVNAISAAVGELLDDAARSGVAITQQERLAAVRATEILAHLTWTQKARTYRIMRYFKGSRPAQRVEGLDNLTLEQAQEHCSRSDTSCDAWMDGYRENE